MSACFGAGDSMYGDGPISSDLKSCCNMENECMYISEITLPEECLSHMSSKVRMFSCRYVAFIKSILLLNCVKHDPTVVKEGSFGGGCTLRGTISWKKKFMDD